MDQQPDRRCIVGRLPGSPPSPVREQALRGRVLLSGSPESAVAQPDFFIKYGISYEVSGSRIPKMKIAVERFLKQEDSDDPASPYAYRAQGQFVEGGRTALSPSDREVLAALSWDEPATVTELSKVVNQTRRRSKEKPRDRRTIEKALDDLQEWNLAAHDGANRDRRWHRIDVRYGQAGKG
jgi:hypothetical protein